LHTTYKDNKYCTDQSVKLLESFKEVDLNYYRIYTLVLWGGALKGLIYEQWEIINELPNEAQFLAYGLDFGFTNSQTAVVKVYIDGRDLILEEILYKTGLTNLQIANELHNVNIGNSEVIADSAEPKSIEELYQMGINVHSANKGKDSILTGISKIKEYNIKVLASGRNIITELKHYKWKVDKEGNSLNEPVKLFDHALDAVRYVVLSKLSVHVKRKRRLRIFGR